jgi:hypothetical protein
MTDERGARPAAYRAALAPADLPALHAYVEDIGRWVLGEAEGATLSAQLRDSLAGELAAILYGGLAPVLCAEVARNVEARIAAAQDGPVTLDRQGRLKVAGLAPDEVARLLDAVARLLEYGVGDSLLLLHPSHLNALYAARDAWSAARQSPLPAEDQPAG